MELKEFTLNPKNPRTIQPAKLNRLVESILLFSKMMYIRPIKYD